MPPRRAQRPRIVATAQALCLAAWTGALAAQAPAPGAQAFASGEAAATSEQPAPPSPPAEAAGEAPGEAPGETPPEPPVREPAPARAAAPRPARRPSRPPPERGRAAPDDPEFLRLRGMPGAWFYRPAGGGRQRVLVYLHPRNGNPREGCRQWREVVARFGWLLCPIGQVERGGGRREWANNAGFARRETIAALEALAARYPRRVRRHDNVIMGFSEGAFVGMNVALLEPLTFPRWFIVAASDGYIDGESERIARAAASVRRVYLLTGAADQIVERTRRAHDVLRRAFGRRRVRMRILEGAGHELPPDFRRVTRGVLLWVTQ